MGRKAACRYIGAQTDQVIEHHLLSSLLEQALRMKHGELMYPVQILGLAAPSQRFGIDGNDVVLVGFGIVYHTVQRLTPPPKAPFSKAVLTRPKPNQKTAPLHDLAAQAASLCAGHEQQLGGESPLTNLMEVKV
jgi:hypothetical protein